MAVFHKLSSESKAGLQLPLALVAELDSLKSGEEEVCFCSLRTDSLALSLGNVRYELRYSDTVGDVLKVLDCSHLLTDDGERVHESTELVLAVVPGVRFFRRDGSCCYTVQFGTHPVAVVAWLRELGCQECAGLFTKHGLEDFFALPFLTAQTLDAIGVLKEHQRKAILSGAKALQLCSPVEFVGRWMHYLGCEKALIGQFASRGIDLQVIREQHLDKLLNGLDATMPSVVLLTEMIESYKNFSSVEETFHWLRRHGFAKYAFHFARYNIPFYALPCVNFFIIDEMGVTHDDQLLLQALQALKTQNFDARAVAFWLRDLELERYNVFFARAGLFTFDAITKLSDSEVERLVDVAADRQKLKTGLLEMQEFQFYYLATASLLQELGMDRYSQLFALHGISIDVLPYLTEPQLIEMGISSKADRKHILAAIAKIKLEIPQHIGVWGNNGAPGGSQQMLPDADTLRRATPGMRKGGGGGGGASGGGAVGGSGSHKLASPSPQAQSRSKATDERSLEELLKFISGGPESPAAIASSSPGGSSASAKKKNRKKNRNKNKTSAGSPALSSVSSMVIPASAEVEVSSISPEQQVVVSAAAATTGAADVALSKKIDPSLDDQAEDEDEAQNEELDPELKKQVDGEVEEFRRRLEAAGQSSKTKLAPIFYLDSASKKNIKH